jgi:hypothetical protein
MHVQSSSHKVEKSHDRSAGNIRSGRTPSQQSSRQVRVLLGTSLNEHIRPVCIEPHSPCAVEGELGSTCFEIAQPPRLRLGMLAEHGKHAGIVALPLVIQLSPFLKRRSGRLIAGAGLLQGGVRLEYLRIADVILNPLGVFSSIHATSASPPVRHSRPSLLRQVSIPRSTLGL